MRSADARERCEPQPRRRATRPLIRQRPDRPARPPPRRPRKCAAAAPAPRRIAPPPRPCRRCAAARTERRTSGRTPARASAFSDAGQVPDLLLERTERLLAGLVVELLVRVARLPLVLRVLVEPARRSRSRSAAGIWSKSMFWKFVARWISAVSMRGKLSNAVSGSVDAPCCTAPASPYSSRATLESCSSASRSSFTSAIDAVRQHHAAVRRARLHRDLREPLRARRALLERARCSRP